MNNLAPAPDREDGAPATAGRYLLPRHAHLVVYERDGDDATDAEDADAATDAIDGADAEDATEDASAPGRNRQLVTIYDCGAAQKPPSAQLLGELGSVRAACETTGNPTGYVVSMREPAVLVDEGDGHYVVRER